MFDILNGSLEMSGIDSPVNDVGSMINIAVNVVSVIAFGVSLVMLAYAFVQYIISTGDPKRLVNPKNALTWSILGLILSLSLFTIKQLILGLLGLNSGNFL